MIGCFYIDDGVFLLLGGDKVIGCCVIIEYFINGYVGLKFGIVLFSYYEFYGNEWVVMEVLDVEVCDGDGKLKVCVK